jgi:hypothetical protein
MSIIRTHRIEEIMKYYPKRLAIDSSAPKKSRSRSRRRRREGKSSG